MDLTAFPEEERPQVLEILANHVCICGYKRKDHKDGDICPYYDHKTYGRFNYSEFLNNE